MSQYSFKVWRGYFYIAAGFAFGLYRGQRVVQWGSWDFFDQLIAIGMIATGIYLIVKK